MAHNVIVYSKSDCIFCNLAMEYLHAKGVLAISTLTKGSCGIRFSATNF